jgi:hypothetical protein
MHRATAAAGPRSPETTSRRVLMDHKLSNREIALGVATFLVALVVMALYG